MLTLSWSDGNTLIPVNSCLLASAKATNIIGPVKDFDNRTIAGKRCRLAQTKAPEAMMDLLDTALSVGLTADYVPFDSWFSNPAQITTIHSKGMDVIAMIKKSSRIKYSYGGKQLSIKEIYSKNKKRRGRSKYLLSVNVMVGKETPIPVKIICLRNKSNHKDWLAFICTDTTLSEEEKEGINNFLHISIDWTEYLNFSYTGIRKAKRCWNGILQELLRNGRSS